MKRSFSSPTRTLGVLFFIFSQLWWLPRAMFRGAEFDGLPLEFPKLQFPPLVVVDSVVFGLFCVFSVIFAMNLLNYRGGFRAADVDVLFPTPVNPRTVLSLRVLRDIWLSLIMPLLMAVVLWRPAKFGWASLMTGIPNPQMANSTFRVACVAYFISAIAWVWIGYAISLAFSKPDVKTDRWRAAAGWLLTAAIIGVGMTVYLRIRGGTFPDNLLEVAQSQDIRAAFFMATAATNMTMSPLTGSVLQGFIGVGVLLASTLVAVFVARGNTHWMYEAAAMRASVTESTRQMRRSGDLTAIVAHRASLGKVKAGRAGWLSRLTVRGAWALLWKEALVIKRSSIWTMVFFGALSTGFAFVAAAIPDRGRVNFSGLFLLAMQAVLLLGPALGQAQAGFIESLRRIDLLKPIPLRSQHIVFLEVVGKAMGPWVAVLIGLVSSVIVKPAMWPFALGGLIMFPPLTLALSAVSLLLVVLLPDVEDPTQRGFRGLATMLGMFACTVPPIALFALLIWLKLPIPVAAVPTGLIMLGITWLATMLAGRIYEDFNPAE